METIFTETWICIVIKTRNIFIIHPETAEQEDALKAFVKALKMNFEIAKEKPYDPEFVAKIERSRKDHQEGKFTRVEKEDFGKPA